MGQLDEAIRAHLELKRKHGASEEALHAEEQEALGPVRREPPAQPLEAEQPDDFVPEPDLEPQEPPGLGPESDLEPPEPADFALPLESQGPAELAAEPAGDATSGYEDPAFDDVPEGSLAEPPAPLDPEDFHEAVESLAAPDVEPPPEIAETPESVGFEEGAEPMEPGIETMEPQLGETPPRGFDAVQSEVAEEEEDPEDVLEETPDFLQETPEHDRLWFEQKPPRDFDFEE